MCFFARFEQRDCVTSFLTFMFPAHTKTVDICKTIESVELACPSCLCGALATDADRRCRSDIGKVCTI